MNVNPAVSIIVPVYKVEKYLDECINSILAQTFKDYEILLIDDGSPDGSGAICDSYASQHNHIRVVHTPNRGVSSARNYGIDLALGEWITFIDSDDFIASEFLAGLYCAVQEHPDVDFIQAGCQTYTDGYTTIEQYYDYVYGDDKEYLFRNVRGLAISKLYKKSILKSSSVRYDLDMRISEDLAFTLDYILYVDKYCFMPEVGYYYRYRSGSLTNPNSYRKYSNTLICEFRHLYNSVYNFINKYGLTTKQSIYRRRQNAERLYFTISHLYLNDENRKVRMAALKNDFESHEINTLKYITEQPKKFILSLYIKNMTGLFDIMMSILYEIKKKNNLK